MMKHQFKVRARRPICGSTMILALIVILLAIAAWLVKSIVAPGSEQGSEAATTLLPQPSEYKQLRIEDHRSIDKSLSPPRH